MAITINLLKWLCLLIVVISGTLAAVPSIAQQAKAGTGLVNPGCKSEQNLYQAQVYNAYPINMTFTLSLKCDNMGNTGFTFTMGPRQLSNFYNLLPLAGTNIVSIPCEVSLYGVDPYNPKSTEEKPTRFARYFDSCGPVPTIDNGNDCNCKGEDRCGNNPFDFPCHSENNTLAQDWAWWGFWIVIFTIVLTVFWLLVFLIPCIIHEDSLMSAMAASKVMSDKRRSIKKPHEEFPEFAYSPEEEAEQEKLLKLEKELAKKKEEEEELTEKIFKEEKVVETGSRIKTLDDGISFATQNPHETYVHVGSSSSAVHPQIYTHSHQQPQQPQRRNVNNLTTISIAPQQQQQQQQQQHTYHSNPYLPNSHGLNIKLGGRDR